MKFLNQRIMSRQLRRILLLILIVGLAGCSTPAPMEETPLPEATFTPTVAPGSTEEISEPEPEGPITLRIWVPPQFDPANGSPEGEIFQARLNEFAARKSNFLIDVRIKNVEGYGGILDTLTTSSAAAPLALPDLVALPRHAMETAAGNGLLHPYEGLTAVLDDPDWYDFARQFSHLQNATFAIPFAGDAIVMNYRSEIIPEPPVDWATSLGITNTLTFPAADPAAIFTLAQYQSLGAPLLDDDGKPTLDVIQFTEVLSYYQQANINELMPFWLTQYESDEQSWEAYEDSQADMAITWASRYLQTPLDDTDAAPIITHDGIPFTLADGWGWVLTTHDPDRQLAAAQLAEFLTTSEYLASWTGAAGLIPPRPSATEAWTNEVLRTFVNQIAPTAQLLPSLETVTVLGPVIQQATISVLKAEADATIAAEAALEKLNNQP
jgi:ABC-type glycerol-3-phosphate transport system substrate-binding protein